MRINLCKTDDLTFSVLLVKWLSNDCRTGEWIIEPLEMGNEWDWEVAWGSNEKSSKESALSFLDIAWTGGGSENDARLEPDLHVISYLIYHGCSVIFDIHDAFWRLYRKL